ncbi:MAG: ABC transporter permease [Proteobacteria bacterium]|jgi:phospholipid/cholesterol/gamma-HCH transport system permease protein|nr:ABC transporter permease [Pseudomonadota bacterium]
MSFLTSLGQGVIFLTTILGYFKRLDFSVNEVFEQIWKVTKESALMTSTAGFFVGAIMTIQFTLQLNEFGALGYLGGLATSGTVREIGPLLIAFMLSGKIGAYTSAELGTMRVTEQIDALKCLGADPIRELVVPRFLAIILSSFFLLGFGLVMSILGGVFMARIFGGISPEEYFRYVPQFVHLGSIVLSFLKCLLFAIILATNCSFFGFYASGGALGVGRAVVKTAVITMVGIVIADWITSQIADVILRTVVQS